MLRIFQKLHDKTLFENFSKTLSEHTPIAKTNRKYEKKKILVKIYSQCQSFSCNKTVK